MDTEREKPGDIFIADGGFTCLKKGQEVTIEADGDGDLFFRCDAGVHWLEGQRNADGGLSGLTRKEMKDGH